MDKNYFYSQFSDEDLSLLRKYLSRSSPKACSNRLNIVLDLLHSCELQCVGCGTNAKHICYTDGLKINDGLSLGQLEIICEKIHSYLCETNQTVFINLGGGEPFLREDISDVIKLFYNQFGKESLGIDTNGALIDSFELISDLAEYVSYIGISLNGLEEYHNWWSGSTDFSAYKRTFETISKLCADAKYADIVEVTSVATNRNLEQLPELMELLCNVGVKKYSVHRSIPVGRMFNNSYLIPNAAEYLTLLINLIKKSMNLDIDFHLHHSIENIHKALLLGENTFFETNYGDPNRASSIGISYEGDIVFNPWCMTGYWKKLNCSNILDEGTLKEKLNDSSSAFAKAKEASATHNRCMSCPVKCSGGSRIAAATSSLINYSERNPSVEEILQCFSAIDPACPLFNEKGNGKL